MKTCEHGAYVEGPYEPPKRYDAHLNRHEAGIIRNALASGYSATVVGDGFTVKILPGHKGALSIVVEETQ